MDSLSPTSKPQNYVVERGVYNSSGGGGERRWELTKVLFKVDILSSLGAVQVMMSPENTIGELLKAALLVYVKEKRRPLLETTDPACYELHYSKFALESLKTDEKLIDLGCRNFFLCAKRGCVVI